VSFSVNQFNDAIQICLWPSSVATVTKTFAFCRKILACVVQARTTVTLRLSTAMHLKRKSNKNDIFFEKRYRISSYSLQQAGKF